MDDCCGALVAMALCLIAVPLAGSSLDLTGKETTMAMVKPDGVKGGFVEAIKASILESGFDIVREKEVRFTKSQAEEFYAEHSGRDFFNELVEFMSSGPIVAMALQRHDAVAHWRRLTGPTDPRQARAAHPQSLRAKCGTDVQRNCVHGSDSPNSAARELAIVFSEHFRHDEL